MGTAEGPKTDRTSSLSLCCTPGLRANSWSIHGAVTEVYRKEQEWMEREEVEGEMIRMREMSGGGVEVGVRDRAKRGSGNLYI